MGQRPSRALALLAVSGVLVLSGCQSDVTSTVDVSGPTEATLSAAVTLEEEAADAVLGDADVDRQVREVLAARTGAEVTRQGQPEDESVTYRVDVPYEKLADASKVLGVGSAALDATGPDEVTVKVTLVEPTELIDAITRGTQGEVDSAAVRAVALETTRVGLVVVLPGDVTSASGPGGVRKDGNRAEVHQRLSAFEAGEVVVVGSSSAPLVTPLRVGVVAAVALLAGLVVASRTRARRRAGAHA